MGTEDVASPRTNGAAWGRPLVVLDRGWTRFETALALIVLALEVGSMTLWVSLKGLSTPAESESHGGVVFRALILALLLGGAFYLSTARRSPAFRRGAALLGVALGVGVAPHVAGVGVDYAGNVLNWLQQASVLALLGGLRGVGTRLTLLLALLGGSLATAHGKHVVLDLTARLLPRRARVASVLAGSLLAAVVCAAAAWGFADHIAIESFDARADASAREKLARIAQRLDEDWFALRAQLSLDLRSVRPVVLQGRGYAEFLDAAEWNAFLVRRGFVERYGAGAVSALAIAAGDYRPPLVVIPGRGEPRGELVHAASLVFPIGLAIVALRFLLRALLVASGHASVDAGDFDEVSPGAPSAVREG